MPIVASNVGGVPDIVGDAGILVPPKNPELLARALKTLINNSELRNDLGARLEDHVTKLFLFQKFLSQTYNLYK